MSRSARVLWKNNRAMSNVKIDSEVVGPMFAQLLKIAARQLRRDAG
jgi:hypothetical protein